MKIRGFLKSVGNVLKHPMDTLEYAIVPMVFRSLKIADELAASSIVRGIESPYKKESYYVSRIAVLDCVFDCCQRGSCRVLLSFIGGMEWEKKL